MARHGFLLRLVLVATVYLFFSTSRPASAEMTVHFIDVGQGGSVLIQKDGKNVLYDCGDTFASDEVIEYLEALNITTIDSLIVSHAHKDHMGGCIAVLKKEGLTVKQIFHNGSKARTKTWKQFLQVAKQKVQDLTAIANDVEDDWLHVLVAYDSHGRYSKEADNSLIALIHDGKVRVLLTGDCEARCEAEISRTSNVRSDILNVGHHGSSAASSAAFLNKVKPKIAVIQAGVNNQYQHPRPDVLTRLKQAGVKAIYRTDKDSSIVILSDGNTVEVETEK